VEVTDRERALEEEVLALRARIADVEEQAANNARQLERYAADLRETFKSERERSAQLQASYMATVRALANAVEARDAYTGKHAERVAAYGLEIARAMGSQMAYDPEIEFGFLLHDIGKVAVPDAILLKPGRLTPDERRIMETHAQVGHDMLAGSGSALLELAATVALTHHERWDGEGYPHRLGGERIPLVGRIVAVADVFDAVTSKRVYKEAAEVSRAVEIIRDGRGTQFDPDVIDAFLAVEREFHQQWSRLQAQATTGAESVGV